VIQHLGNTVREALMTFPRSNSLTLFQVWRMTDGMLLLRLSKGHLSDIRSLAYSPDGKQLVSGGADSTAVIWSLDPVAARCRVQLEDQDTNTLVWTPDGKAIVTGGSSCTVTVW
jgi:WD40 repeat protein